MFNMIYIIGAKTLGKVMQWVINLELKGEDERVRVDYNVSDDEYFITIVSDDGSIIRQYCSGNVLDHIDHLKKGENIFYKLLAGFFITRSNKLIEEGDIFKSKRYLVLAEKYLE